MILILVTKIIGIVSIIIEQILMLITFDNE